MKVHAQAHPSGTGLRGAGDVGDIGDLASQPAGVAQLVVGQSPADVAFAEALNSLYKRELIDLRKDWQDTDDVMIATMDWVQWYNEVFSATFS